MSKGDIMDIKEQMDELLDQEQRTVFDSFENGYALELGYAIAKRLEGSDRPIAIVIRLGEYTVFQYTMKGKEESHYGWANRKANVVEKTGHSSYYVYLAHEHFGEYREFEADGDCYAYAIGGFPINVKDQGRVGVVAVSGLKDPQDHVEVVAAIEKMRRNDNKS